MLDTKLYCTVQHYTSVYVQTMYTLLNATMMLETLLFYTSALNATVH